MCDARLKIRRIEREEELRIVSIDGLERDEIRVLSGVVYKMKRRAPRTGFNAHIHQ